MMFPYLTLEVMRLGMKHGEKGLHAKQVLQLRTFPGNLLQVGMVLARHIRAEELDRLSSQLLL